MKKISLFLLMIFAAHFLFAQEAPKEEPTNEVNEEVKNEANAEAQPEEVSQEAQAQEEQKSAEKLSETSQEQQPDVAAELEQQAEASHEAVSEAVTDKKTDDAEAGGKAKKQKASKQPKAKLYRPYIGIGIPLVVLGSVSVAVLMPAMGAMAFAASDQCKDKDWEFCKQCRNDHHGAWTAGAVLTGIFGAGMVVTGSWLISVKKPAENQYVRLNNVAVVPTKNGVFASAGFEF